MKVALIHDYLTQLGGAEKVLQSFQRLFAESPIFVLLYNRQQVGDMFPYQKIKSTWLQHLPLATRRHQWYLTFMPAAIESHYLDDYDLVLSSASSMAKGVRVAEHIPHICYCHTPTRYLWHAEGFYVEDLKYNKLVKKIIPLFLPRIKHWDLLAAQRVNYFIANSKVVQQRIKKYYQRESIVIYPPVETHKFKIASKLGDYFLAGGRLVAYKRYDLVIQAFNKLGIKLKIFGQGTDYRRLRSMAKKNIEFLGLVDEETKAELYSRALAFINPQLEDFGITVVEAMAAGRPVIAYGAGGALESVQAGKTGEFFNEQIWEALAYQILHFNPQNYDSHYIKQSAERFNVKRFELEIDNFIKWAVKDFKLHYVWQLKK